MSKHYNPWQERFDAVCKEIDKKSSEVAAKRPAIKYESLQEKFDRVCSNRD